MVRAAGLYPVLVADYHEVVGSSPAAPSMFELTKEELLMLVNGKFHTTVCTRCQGKGWYWVDKMAFFC